MEIITEIQRKLLLSFLSSQSQSLGGNDLVLLFAV